MSRKKKFKKLFTTPAFAPAAYGKWVDSIYDGSTSAAKLAPIQQLFAGPSLSLAIAICNVCPATDKDNVSKAITYLLLSYKQTVPLLAKLLQIEVGKCSEEATLFRGNSMTTACFQVYAKIFGLTYLWKSLGQFITDLNEVSRKETDVEYGNRPVSMRDLITDSVEMEVDPNKLTSATAEQMQVNKYQLLLTTQKFFALITNSTDFIPTELSSFFQLLSTTVSMKYPNAKYKSVGALFFLRFVVPTVMTPHVYGLISEPPGASAQRNLTLLSKVLQNLVNEVEFGNKEEYMKTLNEFLVENIPILHRFYDQILTMKPKGAEQDPKIPPAVLENSIMTLHRFLLTYQSKVYDALSSEPDGPEIAKQLKDLLKELNESNELKK